MAVVFQTMSWKMDSSYKQDTNSAAAENPEDDCCEGPSKISKNAIIGVTACMG